MASQAPQQTQPVEDYYEKIHKRTWSRRTSGFLAGATLLGVLGMAAGIVVSVLPPLLHAAGVAGAEEAVFGSSAVLGNAALLGGAAAWLGMSIGADVGANAGSISAGLEEKEKRERANGVTPNKAEQKEPEPKKPVKLFNWKVAALTVAIFATFGALVALSPITASAAALMGFKAGSTAAIITSATTLGLLGATMGLNAPYLSLKLSNAYSSLLQGKPFEKDAPASEKETQPAAAVTIAAPPMRSAEQETPASILIPINNYT